MYFIINNFDRTDLIDYASIQIASATSDPMPTATFDLYDEGSQIALGSIQEVLIIDESVTAQPAVNLLKNGSMQGTLTQYLNYNFCGATTPSYTPGFEYEVNSGATIGEAYLTQTSPPGTVVPGQSYMFSIQAQVTTSFTNANAFINLQFLDASGNAIFAPQGQYNFTTTVLDSVIYVSAQAPLGAAYAMITFGVNVSGVSPTGIVQFNNAQLEPMWFLSNPKVGAVYPSPFMDAQTNVNCTLLPNGSSVYQQRIFAGFINDMKRVYDGPNRVITVQAAGAAMLLESTLLVDNTYVSEYDNGIIANMLNQSFYGLITGNHVVQGVIIDTATYNDISVREALNSLCDSSGYSFYVDPYYDLHYIPPYYETALFSLSDTPDDLTSFAYYDYESETDATQLKNRVKVAGGQYSAGPYYDTFSANGSTATFGPLTHVPNGAISVVSNGNTQKTGFKQVNTFAQGFTCLIDKTVPNLTFSFNPNSGTNNIVVGYTYDAPVLVRETELQSVATFLRAFDSKVNDTALLSPAVAALRALSELVQFAYPLQKLKFTTQQPLLAGQCVPLTHTYDGFFGQLFSIQRVTVKSLSSGITEYQCEAGAYTPDLIDILKNVHKALNRSTRIAGASLVQENVATLETVTYYESLTNNAQGGGSNGGAYSTGYAHYGSTDYSAIN